MLCSRCGNNVMNGTTTCPFCGNTVGVWTYQQVRNYGPYNPSMQFNPNNSVYQNRNYIDADMNNQSFANNQIYMVPNKKKGLSTGAIVGIVIGSILGIIVLLIGMGVINVPSGIRSLDNNRRNEDVSSSEEIQVAAQAALSNEDAYDEISGAIPSGGSYDYTIIASAQAGSSFTYVYDVDGVKNNAVTFITELNSASGGRSPKLKYKKKGAKYWTVGIDGNGKVVVWLSTSYGGTDWELQPSVCAEYKYY